MADGRQETDQQGSEKAIEEGRASGGWADVSQTGLDWMKQEKGWESWPQLLWVVTQDAVMRELGPEGNLNTAFRILVDFYQHLQSALDDSEERMGAFLIEFFKNPRLDILDKKKVLVFGERIGGFRDPNFQGAVAAAMQVLAFDPIVFAWAFTFFYCLPYRADGSYGMTGFLSLSSRLSVTKLSEAFSQYFHRHLITYLMQPINQENKHLVDWRSMLSIEKLVQRKRLDATILLRSLVLSEILTQAFADAARVYSLHAGNTEPLSDASCYQEVFAFLDAYSQADQKKRRVPGGETIWQQLIALCDEKFPAKKPLADKGTLLEGEAPTTSTSTADTGAFDPIFALPPASGVSTPEMAKTHASVPGVSALGVSAPAPAAASGMAFFRSWWLPGVSVFSPLPGTQKSVQAGAASEAGARSGESGAGSDFSEDEGDVCVPMVNMSKNRGTGGK